MTACGNTNTDIESESVQVERAVNLQMREDEDIILKSNAYLHKGDVIAAIDILVEKMNENQSDVIVRKTVKA